MKQITVSPGAGRGVRGAAPGGGAPKLAVLRRSCRAALGAREARGPGLCWGEEAQPARVCTPNSHADQARDRPLGVHEGFLSWGSFLRFKDY